MFHAATQFNAESQCRSRIILLPVGYLCLQSEVGGWIWKSEPRPQVEFVGSCQFKRFWARIDGDFRQSHGMTA